MPNRFFPGYPVHRVDWGFEIVHIIFWALLVGAIVWLVVWLVRLRITGSSTSTSLRPVHRRMPRYVRRACGTRAAR